MLTRELARKRISQENGQVGTTSNDNPRRDLHWREHSNRKHMSPMTEGAPPQISSFPRLDRHMSKLTICDSSLMISSCVPWCRICNVPPYLSQVCTCQDHNLRDVRTYTGKYWSHIMFPLRLAVYSVLLVMHQGVILVHRLQQERRQKLYIKMLI